MHNLTTGCYSSKNVGTIDFFITSDNENIIKIARIELALQGKKALTQVHKAQ